jgi:hypothetical protein
MPSWVDLVGAVGAGVALYMMFSGIVALWTRKMQLFRGGRALYGPEAQWCGLLLLAALPLTAVTCGQVAYLLDVRPDPGPGRAKVMEFFTVNTEEFGKEEKVKWRQELRSSCKPLILACSVDFAVFGMVLAVLAWALVDLRGVRPRPTPTETSQDPWAVIFVLGVGCVLMIGVAAFWFFWGQSASSPAADNFKLQSKIARANYDHIRVGMNVAEVEAILGQGREVVGSGPLAVTVWENAETVITITFQDGAVTTKRIRP